MRIVSYRLVPVMIMFSLLILVSACQEEPIRPEPIDRDSPSIVSLKSDNDSPAPGDSVKFTVTTEGEVTSYSWTADSGSFTDASANPTYWIAPGAAGFYNVTCKVSNSKGSRSSTSTLQVKEEATGMGDAYWPFDLDFKDNAGSNHATGDDFVTISTDTFKAGIGSAYFDSEEETVSGQLEAGSGLAMGVDDEFTVMLWIKTKDEGEGYIFGKSGPDGLYVQGGSCLWLTGDGTVNIDVSWIGGAGGEAKVNDGKWHHVAWTKTGTTVTTYIDGVVDIDNEDIGDWGDDTDFVIVMGAGWENPDEGEWWPGNFQGYLDEVTFYQQYMTEEEIIAVLTNQKAQWPFDANYLDIIGSNHGEGDGAISISTDTFIEGSGSILFESDEETVAGQLVAGSDLAMGIDDDFTVTLWINTLDEGDGFLFGKSGPDGLYVQGGSCIWLTGDGTVNIDVSWIGGAGGEAIVNDGNWHHVAWVKSGTSVTTYIDGVVDINNEDIGDWGDDTDFVIVMGAGWENPDEGEWWPGNYQGYMDDVRFFQSALSASIIQAIYDENAD